MSETKLHPQEEQETIGLKKIIVGYILQWKVFVAVGFVSLILAILYLVLVPKTYEMFARIQIQENDASGGAFGLGEAAGIMKSFGLGGGSSMAISIDDELAILGSNELLRNVIHNLGIQVEYMKPGAFRYKMYKDTPLFLGFSEETNANIMDLIKFETSVDKSGKVKVLIKSKGDGGKYNFEFTSLPATINLPQGTFVLSQNPNATSEIKAPYKMKINVKPASWVAEDLAEELVVDDVSSTSNIMELSVQDYEKRRGLDLLNALIVEYNKKFKEVEVRNADKSMVFIEGRIQNVIDELGQAESKIADFKTKHQMTELEFDLEFYVGQMQELQKNIVELEAEKHVITMLNDYVKNPDNKYNVVPMLLSTTEGEKGGPIASYNLVVMERANILKTSKPESPLIKQMDERLDYLREGVSQTVQNAEKALATTLADLRQKESVLLNKMGGVPAMEREYIDYRRQQEIYQGVYLILLQKREDTALRIGEMKERARLVDSPFIKQKKVAPRKLYAALFMMIFTLVVPIILIETRKILMEIFAEFRKTR